MTTAAQSMNQFLIDIKPTNYQWDVLIPARTATVKENLLAEFPPSSDMPFSESYLIGSAAKRTVIRPIDDVDFMAVFSDVGGAYEKYKYDSKRFLYRIREAYNGLQIQQVGARGQAVRIFFENGGHVDIAPVFFAGGDDYLLPSGDGSWIYTSPLKATSWFASKNVALGYHLASLVQLLKKWNMAHSSRLRSFHLETVAGSIFSQLGSNQRENLRDFFKWSQDRLTVPDPGGHSSDISSYLSWSSRDEVKRSLAKAASWVERAVDAEDAGDHTEAKRLWRIVLGDEFPL